MDDRSNTSYPVLFQVVKSVLRRVVVLCTKIYLFPIPINQCFKRKRNRAEKVCGSKTSDPRSTQCACAL